MISRFAASVKPAASAIAITCATALVHLASVAIGWFIGDAFAELSALGVKSNKDGSLTIDTAKLDTALAADPAAVTRLFDKDAVGSLGNVLGQRLEGAVAANTGLLDTRTKALNDRLKGVASDRERLNVRMTKVEESYRRQYTALDSLVAQLQTTSSFLSQQLSQIANL